MEKLFSILDDLEKACGDEAVLRRFVRPDVSEAIAAIASLSAYEREQLHGQLDRIHTIMEGQMLLYSERMEGLRAQLHSMRASNQGTGKYRQVAAIIPIAPSSHS